MLSGRLTCPGREGLWVRRAGSQHALLPFCWPFTYFLRCFHQAFLGVLAVLPK